MASLNNVVNVSLLPQGRQVARDNMNVVAIMTSQVGTLNSNNRYQIYRDIAAVAADFGTYSDTYDFASAFFNTRPNPIGSAGVLVIGYWRAASEEVAASAATLTGAQLVTETVIDQLQTISDGAFDIDVDGVTESLTALDFRVATSLDDVVDIIDGGLTGAGDPGTSAGTRRGVRRRTDALGAVRSRTRKKSNSTRSTASTGTAKMTPGSPASSPPAITDRSTRIGCTFTA